MLLEKVNEGLLHKENVEIVYLDYVEHLPKNNSKNWNLSNNYVHTLDYLIAPKKGLFTCSALQVFMDSLLTDMPELVREKFYVENTRLKFGKMYADEEVGREEKRIVLHDPMLIAKYGFADGLLSADRTLLRRVTIRPYPCAMYIADFLKSRLHGGSYIQVELSELEKYKPGAKKSFLTNLFSGE